METTGISGNGEQKEGRMEQDDEDEHEDNDGG